MRFGVTDAALVRIADEGVLVMTDDFRLYQYLLSRGRDVINFNHLRAI